MIDTQKTGRSNHETISPELDRQKERNENPTTAEANAIIGRRSFLRGLAAMALLTLADEGVANAAQEIEGKKEEIAEHLAHAPVSLMVVDGIGTASFVDAIVSLARADDSVVQMLLSALRIPHSNKAFHNEHDPHSAKFPLENLGLALILNVIRMSAFGEHEAHETKHEMETTVKGVGLLMGLTSLAKGIVSGEVEANRMAKASPEDIENEPEHVISDSIFQLSYLAAATQIPLTAFGNASIGNSEFTEVKQSFASIYGKLPTSRKALKKLVSAGKISNKQVEKRVRQIIEDDSLKSKDAVKKALSEKAREHANDVISVLMSTACDDAQAAMGDAGPLIGLVQSFGPTEAIKAIPAILPYTALIAVERSIWAAKRAGVSANVLTKERLEYGANFIATTWMNLAMYMMTAAPNVISSFAGKKPLARRFGVGMEFSLIGQLSKDIHDTAAAVFSTILGTFDGEHLDAAKAQEALQKLANKQAEAFAKIGRAVSDDVTGRREVSGETQEPNWMNQILDETVGPAADNETLRDLQERVNKLAKGNGDAESKNINTAIKELNDHFNGLREQVFPELEKAIHDYEHHHGKKPSIMAVAEILKKNPTLLDLVNFNYWHDRIGPELTDTMFVIFLQGLHLVFLINSVSRGLYDREYFKGLPLPAQEWISMGLNEFISMFADNWADCIAHSKWLTKMYFNELDKYNDQLKEKYPEIESFMGENYFSDDATKLVPARFKDRQDQFAALVTYVKRKHEKDEDQDYLEEIMLRYGKDMEQYYWKALLMAMIAAVTGGGKSKLGNAPHFTFAAGHEDFTLMETLSDFKKHPLYHVWEFIFGSAYATIAGPMFAQTMFGGEFVERSQQFLQEKFQAQFPGFEQKLRELEGQKK